MRTSGLGAFALSAFIAIVPACRSAPVPAARDGETRANAGEGAVRVRRAVGTDPGRVGAGTPLAAGPGHELAAFAAGCFWGVEDNLRQVPGVVATAVGYTGGRVDAPSYEAVSAHTTGHAEAVLVEFDPKVVSYATLLEVFFENHDPTTRNRQGPDVGDQYRSEIFTFSPAQEVAARAAKTAKETAAAKHGKSVVTLIEPAARFWKAEEYHQQYDEKTGTHSCPLPKGLKRG